MGCSTIPSLAGAIDLGENLNFQSEIKSAVTGDSSVETVWVTGFASCTKSVPARNLFLLKGSTDSASMLEPIGSSSIARTRKRCVRLNEGSTSSETFLFVVSEKTVRKAVPHPHPVWRFGDGSCNFSNGVRG